MPQGTIKKTDPDKQFRRVMGATTLAGDSVRNSAGESLGTIKELMIDLPTGKVAYAVLSFGGILNMGNKLFAVPIRVPLDILPKTSIKRLAYGTSPPTAQSSARVTSINGSICNALWPRDTASSRVSAASPPPFPDSVALLARMQIIVDRVQRQFQPV
jgi:hypothetical protein